MSEHIKKFIDQVQAGNNIDAGEAFKDALRAKVGDSLDVKRQEMASNMFNQVEAEPFSDPKPEIAGTGTFNQDGSVQPTGNNQDGSVDIDLTQDEGQ
jgi:hypothetical protein